MLMSLHTIARLGILTLAASALAALTAAQLRPESTTPATVPNAWTAVAARPGSMDLIHREDGRLRPITMPRSEHWDYITVSPWASEDGSMEAVARYAALGSRAGGSEGGVGLVRVRLPEGEVLERVETEVMPTGRAAWNLAAGDCVIFPGATGRLYTYRFGDGERPPVVTPIEWQASTPGSHEPFLIDPMQPILPGPRKHLIATMTPVQRRDLGVPHPITPWWLELNEEGTAIVDAGPMLSHEEITSMTPGVRIRHPSVIERDGRYQLLYLRHQPMHADAAVYLADLDFDPETGHPSVRPGTAAVVHDREIALAPLIPCLDYQISSPNDEGARGLSMLFASLTTAH